MIDTLPLFDNVPDFPPPRRPRYPRVPGAQATDTSREAAAAMVGDADSLRAKALELLRGADMTADECARKMDESPLSIRPRFSELRKLGLIMDTGGAADGPDAARAAAGQSHHLEGDSMNTTEHVLTVLSEECAEVSHRVSKALRFGLDEIEPGQSHTNAERIAQEVCDLVAVILMLEDAGIIKRPKDGGQVMQKQAKVRQYMDYARKCGTLLDLDAKAETGV